MNDDSDSRLMRVAQYLQELRAKEDALVFYEWLSGGLVWTDEIPDPRNVSASLSEVLRPLFRYRTTMILGSPDVQYHGYWCQACELFPAWPGFLPERRAPELRELYLSLSTKAATEIDKLLDEACF
jgi:hypothetical protein